jgi:hypothetical protein
MVSMFLVQEASVPRSSVFLMAYSLKLYFSLLSADPRPSALPAEALA